MTLTDPIEYLLPIISVDNFKVVEYNDAFCKLTGFSDEQLLGSEINDYIQLLPTSAKESKLSLTALIEQVGSNSEIDATVLTQHYFPLPVRLKLLKSDQPSSTTKIVLQSFLNKSIDPITKLPNGWAMRCHAEHILADNQQCSSLSLIVLSVDNFSTINFRYGFEIGDMYLSKLGEILVATAGEAVIVARYSNAKFGILFNRSKQTSVTDFNAQIDKLINQLMLLSYKPLAVTKEIAIKKSFSIGISSQNADLSHYHPLEIAAETAMQQAKKLGKSSVVFSKLDTSQKLIDKKLIIDELPNALRQNQIELHYQPQYEISSEKLVGFEALSRWNHPSLGPLSPQMFTTIAEEIGLHLEFDIWVFKRVRQQLNKWLEHGFSVPKIAVNVSFKTAEMPEFIDRLAIIFKNQSYLMQSIEIEITETAAINNEFSLKTNITKLRELGFSIAVDDFGTGYSSLKLVRTYHRYFDKLKLDKSLIDPICDSDMDREFVGKLIDLGRILQLKVLAEGVESQAQLVNLKSLGCHFVQGYYFAKALPITEVETLLSSTNS